jgi:two-component system, NarL family, nitrate/nitrite response regulator NarL
MARILLFTETDVLAVGFVSVLHLVPRLEVDSTCNEPEQLVQLVIARSPDIALIDFAADNLQVVSEIRKRAPGVKIVLWVQAISFGLAFQAMRLGVRGILRKAVSKDVTLECLQKVAAGEVWFDQDLATGFLEATTVELSPREAQLMILVSQGLKNKEIAMTLGISEATVRMYLTSVFRKLHVKDRYELAIFGLQNSGAYDQSIPNGMLAGHEPARQRMSSLKVQVPCPVKGPAPEGLRQPASLSIISRRRLSG